MTNDTTTFDPKTLWDALKAGMDIASGMHTRLDSIAEIAESAHRHSRRLFDVRHSVRSFTVGNGVRREGKRLLTVGTDCSIGKKYTALAIEEELRDRGIAADFRATGQTGIMIAGQGVAIDAVVADFISGAAESLSPRNDPDHWDVVEGQGSCFHPSFAGVAVGLLHGTQPDAFVVCHEPTRKLMRNVATPIAKVSDVIEQTIALGRLTNPAIRCVGVALNTAKLDEQAARECISAYAAEFVLPATDPVRYGIAPIVDFLLAQ